MRWEHRLIARLPRGLYRRIAVEEGGIRAFLEEAASAIPPGSRLLDAGAGEGRYRDLFPRTRYTGIDSAFGEQAWDYRGLDLLGDVGRLPFPDGCFDAILSTQVLEHVPEPAAMLAELARVLHPDGLLLLTAPQAFGEHQEPHDYFRFTSFGLRHLLGEAGFQVESLEPRGGLATVIQVYLLILHERLFPTGRSGALRLLSAPLRLLSSLLLVAFPPLILQPLDRLDRRRDTTLGYAVKARRV